MGKANILSMSDNEELRCPNVTSDALQSHLIAVHIAIRWVSIMRTIGRFMTLIGRERAIAVPTPIGQNGFWRNDHVASKVGLPLWLHRSWISGLPLEVIA